MIEWKPCAFWTDEVYFRDAGIILRVGSGKGNKWFGMAATTVNWFSDDELRDAECKRGSARNTVEAAKNDAIRLGKELVEDILVSALQMAKVFGVDVCD